MTDDDKRTLVRAIHRLEGMVPPSSISEAVLFVNDQHANDSVIPPIPEMLKFSLMEILEMVDEENPSITDFLDAVYAKLEDCQTIEEQE